MCALIRLGEDMAAYMGDREVAANNMRSFDHVKVHSICP